MEVCCFAVWRGEIWRLLIERDRQNYMDGVDDVGQASAKDVDPARGSIVSCMQQNPHEQNIDVLNEQILFRCVQVVS
jgi:hypothetical protein